MSNIRLKLFRINKPVLFLLSVLSAFTIILKADCFVFLSFMDPVMDVLKKIEKVKEKIEEKYNTYLETLDAKVQKAFKSEGISLYESFIADKSNFIIPDFLKGQFNVSTFMKDNLLETLTGELGNMKLDYFNAKNLMDEYVKTAEKVKLDKDAAMKKELAALQSQRAAVNSLLIGNENNEELKAKLDELDKNIALLNVQIKDNLEISVLDTPEIQKYKNKLTELQNKMDSISGKTSDLELQKMTSIAVDNLFAENDNSAVGEDIKEAYKITAEKLFLKEDEIENSENIARINRIRHAEYYNAHRELMHAVINTYNSFPLLEEKINGCAEAGKVAQGIFGESAMRICADFQNAKAAAWYMDLLLADMRFSVAAEIQTWNQIYKLKNYDRDMSRFDIDEYIMQASDLVPKGKNSINNVGNLVSGILGK